MSIGVDFDWLGTEQHFPRQVLFLRYRFPEPLCGTETITSRNVKKVKCTEENRHECHHTKS